MTAHVMTLPALRQASRAALAGLPADLAFCHPAIRDLGAIDDAAGTLELQLAPGTTADADLERQVRAVVALSLASYRFVESPPPLWRHDASAHAGGASALGDFVTSHTRTLGPGQYALLGPAAELRAWFDGRILELARGVAAESWHLPSIECSHDLIKATGYLASHGQHVSFGFQVPPHHDTLCAFAERARSGETRPDPAHLEPTGFILEPFVCHNVYRSLRGERLLGGRAITALGTCYRHEGFRFRPLLRQWEFSMREIVLAGPAAWVDTQRRTLIALAQALAVELDLDARLEVATDPFFVAEAAAQRTYQAMASTKLELWLATSGSADGSGVAGTSFNSCGRVFSQPMDIRGGDGEPVETACVGFGLERWMAAFVARWGADPARWPELHRRRSGHAPGGAGWQNSAST